jgi:thiol-disulfide isomerase/thioredoxin
VLVGILCLLDLVLTFGVVRRLRQHTQLLDAQITGGRPAVRPRPGHRVGDFAVADVHGRSVNQDVLGPGTLVGFFTTDCTPCKELLPRFVTHVTDLGLDPDDVLAVLAAPTVDEAMIARLGAVARVVVQEPDGPMVRAFDLSGFPTLVRMGPGGMVEAAGAVLEAIRGLVPAPVRAGMRAAMPVPVPADAP